MSMLTNPTLVLNCGSSSIKYALISSDSDVRITGLAENLGLDNARVKHTDEAGNKSEVALAPKSGHKEALATVLKLIEAHKPVAVGHRVVHGGHKFSKAAKIDDAILDVLKEMTPLAPLHNPANILGIEAIHAIYPELPNVAVFDTAFHQSMPPKAYRYAIPKALYTEHHIRRYGFHGTSHNYVSARASQLANTGETDGWITAHLGNGCSLAAVYDRQSLDTSMGLTPLEGVVMGTRSGDIDPSLHIHLHRTLGYSLEEIDNLLNKKSGLLGLSDLSNDMRAIEEAANAGNEDAKLALEVFCYKVARYIAALSCALPKFTGIIFTGGIGENGSSIRAGILGNLPHFGIAFDGEKNAALSRGAEGAFHQPDSRLQLWVIPTDEEGQIARETKAVLGQAV